MFSDRFDLAITLGQKLFKKQLFSYKYFFKFLDELTLTGTAIGDKPSLYLNTKSRPKSSPNLYANL